MPCGTFHARYGKIKGKKLRLHRETETGTVQVAPTVVLITFAARLLRRATEDARLVWEVKAQGRRRLRRERPEERAVPQLVPESGTREELKKRET